MLKVDKSFENYILRIGVTEADRSTVTELQYCLLVFLSDTVSPQLVSLAVGDLLAQTEEVRAH